MTRLQDEHAQVIAHALELFRRPNPSGGEYLVRAYITEHLRQHSFSVEVDPFGNVLATRGVPEKQQGYPLLSFHMDSVEWRYFPKPYFLRPLEALALEDGVIHSRGKFIMGGDDKCGAAIALTLAACTKEPLKIVASVEEEIGCLGISEVAPTFFDDVCYALVLDRKENHDLITSVFDRPLCTEPFVEAMKSAAALVGHTVEPTEGMLSDAYHLSWFIKEVVNLSVGYYQPHFPEEYVVVDDLLQSYRWVHSALLSLSRTRFGKSEHLSGQRS